MSCPLGATTHTVMVKARGRCPGCSVDRTADVLRWLNDLMVDGEYGRRQCCWTDPDKGGHKDGCELAALIVELERAAHNTDTLT